MSQRPPGRVPTCWLSWIFNGVRGRIKPPWTHMYAVNTLISMTIVTVINSRHRSSTSEYSYWMAITCSVLSTRWPCTQ